MYRAAASGMRSGMCGRSVKLRALLFLHGLLFCLCVTITAFAQDGSADGPYKLELRAPSAQAYDQAAAKPGILPASFTEGLDLHLWGWVGYSHVSRNDPASL